MVQFTCDSSLMFPSVMVQFTCDSSLMFPSGMLQLTCDGLFISRSHMLKFQSADPVEMLHFPTFHLGLHCLPKCPFTDFKYTKG